MSTGKTPTKILFIILALIVGGFLWQTGVYYYKIKTGQITDESFEKKFTSSKNAPATPATLNAAEIMGAGALSYGAEKPKLTIVEFGNFACPNSQTESQTAREMMLKYNKQIKFIYRDFPLDDIYPGSSLLSLAGKCAGEQGKFWAMHDKLYQAPKSDLAAVAAQIGLNEKQFSDCLSKQKYGEDIQKDFDDGYKNGVLGTPTFFFIKNDMQPVKVQGAMPKDAFEQIVNDLLK